MRHWSIVLAVSLLAGCTQTAGEIDRTQANRVDKAIFDGEWFYMKTVVDVPKTAEFTFVGEQPDVPMDRIVWEVQEKVLYARRAREFVMGTEIGRLPTAGTYRGAPLAAFEIESHFDVIREYNSSTGEPTNVIVENDEDNPWYEREYMRVNWGQNLVAQYDLLGSLYFMHPDEVMEISSYLDEAALDDPDRAIITDGYVDVVERMFAQPSQLCEDWNDDGVIGDGECDPACWYSYLEDCAGAEVRVRHSFLKASERDFEARHYDDHDLERFGYFRSERYDWDRRRGMTETGRRFWQQRWDIWEADHTGEACTEDAECVGGFGARCDPVVKRCTLPYADRVEKPIVYHLSVGFPERYRPTTERAVAQWNRAFQQTVNVLKYDNARKLACLPGEEGGGGCCTAQDYAGGGGGCVPNVFLLRDNDCNVEAVERFARSSTWLLALRDRVAGGPPEDLDELRRTCAAFEHATLEETREDRQFRWQRLGDLRYSLIYWVDAPNWANPLGYGPSGADPLTGEIVQATVNCYGAEIESYAMNGVDAVRVLNGELTEEALIGGVNVETWVEARISAERQAEHRRRTPAKERIRRMSKLVEHPPGDRGTRRRRSSLPNTGRDARQRHRELIRGTPLEARLIPDQQRLLLGRTPAELGQPLTAAERSRLSPVTGLARRHAERHRRHLRESMRRRVYRREFADPTVLGLAQSLIGMSEDEAFEAISDACYAATLEHEIGHTLGLMHNFAGSADPLNYHRSYWDQRGETPEPFAEVTDDQIAGQMPLFQYSSIMDYGARFHSDLKGLGPYDVAAIAFGYGHLDTVFSELHERITSRMEEGDTVGDVLAEFHYTKFPDKFGGTAAMFERELVPAWTAPERVVPYKYCGDEYSGALWDCDVWDRGADAFEIARYSADSYREYYVFDSFKRDLVDFDEWGYSWHIQDRYFRVLMKLFQHWWYFDYDDEWRESRDQGAPLTLAAQEALKLFWDVLSTPDRGRFCYDDADDLWWSEGAWEEWYLLEDCERWTEPVPLGMGRPAEVVFDWDLGYYFFQKIQQIGSYYDKSTVMDAMSLPEVAFIGLDTEANADALTFTFFDAFPKLMTRLFGGIMTGHWDWFGPRAVERDGVVRVEFWDPTLEEGGDAAFQAGQQVYPEIEFMLQIWAAWDSMLFFTFAWDQRFNDAMRIYIKGSGEDSTPADPSREETFEDPFSGRIYAAQRYDDPQRTGDPFPSPAWQLVTDMKDLEAERQTALGNGDEDEAARLESELRYRIDLADLYRGLYDLYGKST